MRISASDRRNLKGLLDSAISLFDPFPVARHSVNSEKAHPTGLSAQKAVHCWARVSLCQKDLSSAWCHFHLHLARTMNAPEGILLNGHPELTCYLTSRCLQDYPTDSWAICFQISGRRLVCPGQDLSAVGDHAFEQPWYNGILLCDLIISVSGSHSDIARDSPDL